MNLQDKITLDLPIDKARSTLLDEEKLVSMIAHKAHVVKVSHGEYSASIPIAIFLLKSELALKVTLEDQKDCDSRQFTIDASGKVGKAQMNGDIHIFPEEKEKTTFAYNADIIVQGSLASMAEQYIRANGTSFVRKALERLTQKT